MGRCGIRLRGRASVLWSVLSALVASLGTCSAAVDVVVNLANADRVDPESLLAVRSFLGVSSMDNSDLFVAMCLPGTFSPDDGGVCHDCVRCLPNQYERQACIPIRDRACANCTVCGTHDIELCQCSVKTTQCVTGDRVCLKVPPTVVNLVVDFSSNGVLTNKQQVFIRSGLAVGYTDWLAMQFEVDPETVELTDFVKTGPTTYKAYFRFGEVYGEAKIARIQGQPEEFFQGGIYYTFGGGGRRRRLLGARDEPGDSTQGTQGTQGTQNRRRLLQSGVGTGYLTASGAQTSCEVDKNCTQPFTEFQFFNGSQCSGFCAAIPCPPGFSGSATNCQPCPADTFKNESGFGDCTECPADHTSPTGSNSSEACVPIPTTTTAAAAADTSTSEAASSTSQTTTTATTEALQSSSSTPPPSSAQPTSASSPTGAPSPTRASSSPPQTSSAPSPAQPGASSSQPGSASGTSSRATPEGPRTTSATTATTRSGTSTSTAGAAPTSTTSSSTGGGTGSPSSGSSGGSGGSNVITNNNAVNSNVNVQVNIPPPPIQPPPPPPIQPQPQPQPPRPIFNNYVTIQQQPPPPSMPDKIDYHRHFHYGDGDDWLDDWTLLYLLLLFFLVMAAATTCLCSPGCGCGGCPCYYYGDPPPARHVVRYEIVRQRDNSGGV